MPKPYGEANTKDYNKPEAKFYETVQKITKQKLKVTKWRQKL